MDIHLNRDGTGTILFVTGYYGRRGRQYFRLENLDDVAGAQNAILQMKKD